VRIKNNIFRHHIVEIILHSYPECSAFRVGFFGGVMTINFRFVSVALAAVISQAAFAQTVSPPQPTTATQAPLAPAASPQPAVAVIEASPKAGILRAGTEIALTTREELTTKKKRLRVGQRFQMEVGSSIISNGAIFIPGGTPVVGEITEVRNKGMWGKSGFISARVISMRLADRVIRMSGTFDDKGVAGGVGAALVSGIIFLPAGFFMTGTSALIPIGSPVKAFIDEDIVFSAPSATP
jgi:hypothetical protein